MNHKTIRLIGVLFAIVCIVSGGVLVAHAQDDTSSISASYDYNNEEVDYQIDGSPSEPYSLELLEATSEYGGTLPSESSQVSAYKFRNDGTQLWTTDSSDIYQYELSTPYSVSTASETPVSEEFVSEPAGMVWSGDGSSLVVLDDATAGIYQYDVSEPYDLSSTVTETTAFGIGNGGFAGPLWLDGGSIFLFHIGDLGDTSFQSCSTDYDVSTCQYIGDQSTPGSPAVTSMSVNDDESELFYGTESGDIYKYNITNDYDLTDLEVLTPDETTGQENDQISWIDSGNGITSIAGESTTFGGYRPAETLNVWLEDMEGNQIDGTETQTTTQTGSISYSTSVYEQITANYEVAAETGRQDQSNPIAIYGNGEIDIREEQTNNLVTEPVNVTAYGEESGIYSLDTSSGTIDITGLPDQAYTFSTDATGYTLRNKYVEELGNTESLYLLANDTERLTTQFLLEDTTNTFTSDARLVIERSIEGNGNDWEEIYSDSFGVEGVTATLQEDVRYRISIENDEIRRTIGPYRATISEQVTINPDSGEIGVDSEGGWSMGANYDDDHINVRYTDPEDMTDSVSVTIHERGKESNTIIESDTYTNPEDLRTEYQVPPQYNESNWIVSLEVNRGGETTVISMQVGPTLDTVPSDLDPMWRNIISVIVILTFGLAFSALNRAVGAIVLALVGGALWWVGWLAGATAGVLITAYLFIAIGYGIYTKTVA